MAVVWTIELPEMLIDLSHYHSVLWVSTDKHYEDKVKKKASWKSISNFMRIHELEIRRKIKNLTSQFFREKKKIKEDTKSGTTPKWFAYQSLLFLADKHEHRTSADEEKGLNEAYNSDSEQSTEVEDTLNQSIKEENIDDIASQPVPEPQPVDQHPGPSLTLFQIIQNRQGSKRRQPFLTKGKRRHLICWEKLKLRTLLEALNSSYAQNMVEHLISNILYNAGMGKYDHPATRDNDTSANTFL
uniref:Uncharacterized protein LOC114344536 n=1 Tax=Diabrotica virgifera virgifera TaxID=50390 RepID=A0A6P7H0B9_DIAVI